MEHNVRAMNACTIRFLVVFFLVFFATAVVLFVIDFVPERPEGTRADGAAFAETANAAERSTTPEVPTRVVIERAGVDTVIENPSSSAIPILDDALLSGAVRYPGSALLGEDSTMFLFGHQSGLPVVRNPAFKAFNGLQKLEAGDVIKIYSTTSVYEYAVRSVALARADEALIPLTENGQNLFLSTCNSFGDPGERVVVEAEYLGRTAIN